MKAPFTFSVLFVLWIYSISIAMAQNSTTIAQKWTADKVTPDVTETAPGELINVTYEKNLSVNLGTQLTIAQVASAPTLISWPADPNSLYTLFMIDPDAPTRSWSFLGPALHWLVVNIPGSDVAKGETLSPYGGAGPPPLTGLHRYVFVLYKQSDGLRVLEKRRFEAIKDRMWFKLKAFSEVHNLGSPVAGNYFQTKYGSS